MTVSKHNSGMDSRLPANMQQRVRGVLNDDQLSVRAKQEALTHLSAWAEEERRKLAAGQFVPKIVSALAVAEGALRKAHDEAKLARAKLIDAAHYYEATHGSKQALLKAVDANIIEEARKSLAGCLSSVEKMKARFEVQMPTAVERLGGIAEGVEEEDDEEIKF